MVCLFLAFPLLIVVAASENMVCSKFGYNWAAEIRCLRALLSQCKRSSNNREVRKVPPHWNEYSNNFVALNVDRRAFPVVLTSTSTTSTTTTQPPTERARENVDVAGIIANLTEHFENRLRKLKDVMQLEQQERITALQARFENELKISEMKVERKFSDLKRKQESELKKLMKRLDLAASRPFRYTDKEYIFVEDRKSWYEAEEDCLSWGGHLTSISDEHENSFVRGLLQADSAWIGVNDVQVENIFVNSDKTPVAYKNFQEGEPDNASHNENCVAMEASGEWMDAFCLVTKPFICKR
ncbi:lectin C-type domain protein [Ancylostoma caninum]|uniref:Lectin C-type domain protein n=1 Tax=Ancylostoma caninum TaxID=29170 RepID=A0A368H854_ANCCA|nr:lectin C-type domain protein [Ancylostoma caninum]